MKLECADAPMIQIEVDAYIRPICVDDVTMTYVDGLNDPDVNCFLTGPGLQRETLETVRAYVRENREASDALLFGLFINNDLRGTSRLHDITSEFAYLGIALFDKKIWGMGWGSKIISMIVKFAFYELGVKCIRAGIESDNVASQKAFAKSGFICLQPISENVKGGTGRVWEYRCLQ